MINVTEIVNDPDFAQPFIIFRSKGQFVAGGFTDTKTTISFYGSIQVANPNELEMVPEGDRVKGVISIHTEKALYLSRNRGDAFEQSFGKSGFGSPNSNESDIVQWRNQQYKCMYQYPWVDFGYFKTLAVRMSGE